jgi:hypothetical protein
MSDRWLPVSQRAHAPGREPSPHPRASTWPNSRFRRLRVVHLCLQCAALAARGRDLLVGCSFQPPLAPLRQICATAVRGLPVVAICADSADLLLSRYRNLPARAAPRRVTPVTTEYRCAPTDLV